MTTPAVLCLAPHLEDRLLPQLAAAGVLVVARPPGAAEAAEAVGRLRPEVLIASAESRHLDGGLLLAASAAGVAVVVLAEGERGRAHAAALGVPDPLDASVGADDIAARIEHGVAAPLPVPSLEPAALPGRVTAVWGPAGAPGRTTTAIALAAELAAAGLRVALVDADTIGAAVAPSLGLLDEAPGLAAACRLAAAGALSGAELDRVAQRYRCTRGELLVLTGIGRPARWPELSADRVTKVLEQCRSWADHTIVDTGFNLESDEEIVSDLFAPRRNAATLAAVQAADTVVAVGAGDPIGLARYVRAFGDLVELVEPHRVRAVVGKVRQSAVGLGAGGQIRASLQRFGGIDDVTLVPSDPAACDAALLTARPLPDAAPRSAATAALRRFTVDHLIDRPSARNGGACPGCAVSGTRRPDVGATHDTDPVSDPEDDDRRSEPYHPVDRELEVSSTYADPEAFDDDDITDRLQHYEALQQRDDLLPRQRAVLDRIVARLAFEFVRRMDEEFAPKPGDDEYLAAYEDPSRIDRDFEDPLDR